MNWLSLKDTLKCGACEAPLKDSKQVNVVLLLKEAEWQFPNWGNILLGIRGFASSVLCDKCVKEHKKPKLAVEWNPTTHAITYHPVDKLKDVDPHLFDLLDVLEPGRHGIAG